MPLATKFFAASSFNTEKNAIAVFTKVFQKQIWLHKYTEQYKMGVRIRFLPIVYIASRNSKSEKGTLRASIVD